MTGGFVGAAPDIGAYELGADEYWIPGRRGRRASRPIPNLRAVDQPVDRDLIFLLGYGGIDADIYLGESPSAVVLATRSSTEFKATLSDPNNVYRPAQLEAGRTYFWRVDTVTSTETVKGEIWSFSTVPAPGLNERRQSDTIDLPEAPPILGYSAIDAFPGLGFVAPIAMATPAGETNRLFVAERGGVVSVIPDLTSPTRSVVMDISEHVDLSGEGGLLGIAFHPDFAVNGYFFLYYSTIADPGASLHQRVSRFQISSGDGNVADPATEIVLISQKDNGVDHNGGDLQFGPDGYLYISVGDGGGENDQHNNSQTVIKDFMAGILRIDVDSLPGSRPPNVHPAAIGNYSIPPDNPFVGLNFIDGATVNPATVRTEFWATGLRNPRRMSFDPATGLLYSGDEGQGAREEINIIEPGGNYGWAVHEGTIAGPRPDKWRAFVDYLPPIQEYERGLLGHGRTCLPGTAICRPARELHLQRFCQR